MRFDLALRAEPLDRRRADLIITGPSRFAYASLSTDAQRARVDDVVRAAMKSPVNHGEDIFAQVRALLTDTLGVASVEQVTLRAAQFVSSVADIVLVLGPRRAPLFQMSAKGVGPLFTLLIGRAALTTFQHERSEMLDCIRRFDADLEGRVDQDIDAMIAARPSDGKLADSIERLIDAFRVRANEQTGVPSRSDLDTQRALDDDVRQMACLAYWLDCLGHPDLPALIDLPEPERWLVIEDHAADVGKFADELEALVVRFAEGVRPIKTALRRRPP